MEYDLSIQDVGEKIKRARRKLKLSQKDLAMLMDTTQQNIAQYECGKRQPKFDTIKKFANALNISLIELISDSPEETKKNFDESLSSEEHFYSLIRRAHDNSIIRRENFEIELMDNLFKNYNLLNQDGKEKAVEQVELLTKIPEYRKDKQPILQAAHEDNPTPEQKVAANRIMEDDSEWE